MSSLTIALFAALALYLGGWWLGYWIGNFSLLLLVMTLATFAYWVAERLWFAPARRRAAEQFEREHEQRAQALQRQGIDKIDTDVPALRQKLLMQPWWLDWTAGLFPVILAVFLLRSFVVEPFKIPSGSMIPTLLVGDLILVNKYHYGLRLPVLNRKIIANHDPQAGDVVVFRYPVDPRIDYIKRVVGVPGDEVAYVNQRLTINGKPVPTESQGDYYDEHSMRYAKRYAEQLGARRHDILVDPSRVPMYGMEPKSFPMSEACRYSVEGVVCKVPPGHYFMMGDNRDDSQDSRYWGFVPDENIVGRAFLVWMNFGNLGRIGSFN